MKRNMTAPQRFEARSCHAQNKGVEAVWTNGCGIFTRCALSATASGRWAYVVEAKNLAGSSGAQLVSRWLVLRPPPHSSDRALRNDASYRAAGYVRDGSDSRRTAAFA